MIDKKDVFSAFSEDNNISDMITKIYDKISKEYHEKREYMLISDIIDIYNGKYKNYDDYKKHMEDIIKDQRNESDPTLDALAFSIRVNINVEPIILSESTYEHIRIEKFFSRLSSVITEKEERENES